MWKVLPADQKEGIKNFIVGFIIKNSSDKESLKKNKLLLNKLNIVLVQILKQYWPEQWPTFIPEIVSASLSNPAQCENNMAILKLLSEEIFDYSAEQMTSQKISDLKEKLSKEFSSIFELCYKVLESSDDASLVGATLETLLRFLHWIPITYIFDTNLLNLLCERFFEVNIFRNSTIKCLTEIASLKAPNGDYEEKFCMLFDLIMKYIPKIVPVNTNIAKNWETMNDFDQQYVQNLALFFTSFLSTHLEAMEITALRNDQFRGDFIAAHLYLLAISRVEDRELFKICLEYWTKLVSSLYKNLETMPHNSDGLLLRQSSTSEQVSRNYEKNNMYSATLTQLRVVMIESMVKPEEVLVVENDEGEIVREQLKESDTIILYKTMREVLIHLTHLNVVDMQNIMNDKLAKQMDESEWSWNNINKLCWAIGSISGAMKEDTEKKFLVHVIKDLLSLTERKKGKDNKAVVASNIMYIVGQYPRFLQAHWKFLKTVINKLFEFMHELHEGVQDMACDTFMKIVQRCRRHFIIQQSQENTPFINVILDQLENIISDLSPQQVHTFYEAIGVIISSQTDRTKCEELIKKFMHITNIAWDETLTRIKMNSDTLNDPQCIKILGNIIKSNVAACTSIGPYFFVQIELIYGDLLRLYAAVSDLITQSVAAQGEIATKTPRVRGLRTIKKEILHLVEVYISSINESDSEVILNDVIPPLFETILGDYARSIDQARDAAVTSVIATIVDKIGEGLNPMIPAMLDAVFEPTLNMINKNFEEYPEHRVGFYKMIKAMNDKCFIALVQLPPAQFSLILNSIVWAFKHTMRDISDLGLVIVLEMLNNFSKQPQQISNTFYQQYFLSLLQDILFVLTSAFQRAGLKYQVMILIKMFSLVDQGSIGIPLWLSEGADAANVNFGQIDVNSLSPQELQARNKDFFGQYITQILRSAFPHVSGTVIEQFVIGLYQNYNNPEGFGTCVKDFLVSIKEFSPDAVQEQQQQ